MALQPGMRWGAILLAMAVAGCARNPAILSGPQFTDPRVKVTDEQVRLRCRGNSGEPRCRVEARYRVDNTSGQPLPDAVANVLSARVKALHIHRAHDDQRQDLAEGEAISLPVVDSGFTTTDSAGMKQQLRVDLPQGESDLVIHGEAYPGPKQRLNLMMPAPLVRHVLMARWLGVSSCRFATSSCLHHFDYLSADRGDVLLTVDHPPGWSFSVDSHDQEGRQRSYGGRSVVAAIHAPPVDLSAGGPKFGVGTLLAEDAELRWRFGYEAFAPEWVAYSVMLEGSADGGLVLAPGVEFVAPMVLVLPSVGAGVGVPIRVRERDAGARFSLSLQYPLFGIAQTVDWYPATGDAEGVVYLQLGL